MTVLAHGAGGPTDELILLVPAAALLVLAVMAVRRWNIRHSRTAWPSEQCDHQG